MSIFTFSAEFFVVSFSLLVVASSWQCWSKTFIKESPTTDYIFLNFQNIILSFLLLFFSFEKHRGSSLNIRKTRFRSASLLTKLVLRLIPMLFRRVPLSVTTKWINENTHHYLNSWRRIRSSALSFVVLSVLSSTLFLCWLLWMFLAWPLVHLFPFLPVGIKILNE